MYVAAPAPERKVGVWASRCAGAEGNTENGEYGVEVAEGYGVMGGSFRELDEFAAGVCVIRERLADGAKCVGAVHFVDTEGAPRAVDWGLNGVLEIGAGSDGGLSAESIRYSSSASVSQRCQDGIKTS